MASIAPLLSRISTVTQSASSGVSSILSSQGRCHAIKLPQTLRDIPESAPPGRDHNG